MKIDPKCKDLADFQSKNGHFDRKMVNFGCQMTILRSELTNASVILTEKWSILTVKNRPKCEMGWVTSVVI